MAARLYVLTRSRRPFLSHKRGNQDLYEIRLSRGFVVPAIRLRGQPASGFAIEIADAEFPTVDNLKRVNLC